MAEIRATDFGALLLDRLGPVLGGRAAAAGEGSDGVR